MWALFALAFPCPVSLLLCNGLLPPVVLVGVIANTLVHEPRMGWVVVAPLVLEGAAPLWLLRWLATRLVGRLSPRVRVMAMACVILTGLLPIYFFDCMDGHPTTRCSVPDVVRAVFTEGRQCGDLGW